MPLSLILKLSSSVKIGLFAKRAVSSFAPGLSVRLFPPIQKSARFLNPARIANNAGSKRTFFQFFRKPTAEQLKATDNIPDDYVLIYRNAMHRYLLSAQIFSTVSAAIVCLLALGYEGWEYNLHARKWRLDEPPQPIENEGLIYAGSFVFLCVILQLMVSKMPIRIYNLPQKEKYVFVFYGSLPTTKRRLVCRVKDVVKLEESGLLPWKDSRYEIRNKRHIIMIDHYFRRPADLNILLGYQKPPEDYE